MLVMLLIFLLILSGSKGENGFEQELFVMSMIFA